MHYFIISFILILFQTNQKATIHALFKNSLNQLLRNLFYKIDGDFLTVFPEYDLLWTVYPQHTCRKGLGLRHTYVVVSKPSSLLCGPLKTVYESMFELVLFFPK